MMRGMTFQNLNYAGEDAAIITTKAFTVVDLHFLNINNVVSQGVSVFCFANSEEGFINLM